MVPAQQRLAALHRFAVEVHHGLVVQFELVVRQRLAELELEGAARFHARVHPGLEETIDGAAVRLRAVERHVGVLEKLVGFDAVDGRYRDADAGGGDDHMTLKIVGRGDHLGEAKRQPLRIGRVRDVGLNDREFIAADA